MNRKGYAAALAVCLASLASAGPAQAEAFSLAAYRAGSARAADFNMFPLVPVDRIYRRAAPREAAPGASGRKFVLSGTPVRKLKQLIGRVDAGAKDYDAVQHGARIRPGKRPTQMTIGEIFRWIDRTPGQHHAIGRYQFIPSTLRAVVREAGLGLQTRFSPETQDFLADILLDDAGLEAFLAGQISRHRFMENLARIWAAFPTSTGRSHYHGIAGNRAVISWNEFDTHMQRIFVGRRG